MRTLILGDIHVSNRDEVLREAQIACLAKIFNEANPDEVVQLGDFLDFRKPSPEALLAAKSIIDFWSEKAKVVILRGNHCASTKADDGVTALSVFDSEKVDIITHTEVDHLMKRVYIPHYENAKLIIKTLHGCPKGYTVFGHFGYYGCLNSVGDHDFDINVDSFRNNTILGHIHRKNSMSFECDGEEKQVLILGTPYTVNFGESGKDNFYAILEDDEISLHEIFHGPRHWVVKNKDLGDCVEYINDENYYTMLRVILEAGETKAALDNINVASIDIKYAPAFDEEKISNYDPTRDLFHLNDVIIEDYIESANSSIEKDKLMEGYNLLKHEN